MRCLFVLDLVILFYCLFFSLAAKLIGPRTGCQFFKNVDFLDQHPLKGIRALLKLVINIIIKITLFHLPAHHVVGEMPLLLL